MIIDARRSNRRFRDPPGVELLSSEGFARIEVEVEEGLTLGSEAWQEALSGFRVALGMADVKDCFHRYRQPPWLSEYFALPPLRASELGLTGGWLGGKALGTDTPVYPCPGSLHMHGLLLVSILRSESQ